MTTLSVLKFDDPTAPDEVVDELVPYDFEIISTNLPEDLERHLREAFAEV